MIITPAFALAATAAIVHGLASGQQPQAEIPISDAASLVQKIVDRLGGEAAVARVNSTKSISTRHAKTPYGDATISVEQIAVYPDRIWMATKAPQFVATTVLTPADSFTIMAGAVRELPAAVREEAARVIKLGVISVAKHAKDPEYKFTVRGVERIGDLRTVVLEIVVNGDKATWNVDPSTGRLLRATRTQLISSGAASETTFEYSDWRTIDGLSVPFRIAQSGSISAVDDVTSLEINPPLPPGLFDRPSVGKGDSNGPPPQTSTNLSAPTGTVPRAGVPQPAGGKWTYEIGENKLTGALYGIFSLEADERITDGIGSALPSFVIMCGGRADSPQWLNSKVLSPVVLGKPDYAFGERKQMVYLRADNKIHMHFWNMAEDFRTFFVDKGATKELLNSTKARIQFRDSSEHNQVAIFSPSGLNREGLVKACGNAFK